MFEQAHTCSSCKAAIPAEHVRVHCQVCQDYNSCADCHVVEAFGGNHHANHDYEVFMHGQRILTKKNGSTQIRTQAATGTEDWGTLITPGKTPSATFSGLIRAIFAHFDEENAGMLQPREFCAFMSAADWSPQEFPPIQVLLGNSPALPAALHECDAWLANWYRTFLLDHRMGTREFAPPPPVQPHEGRIRKRDQFMHAIMHPPAPVVPGGMPLLTQQGLVQYFMCLALRAPEDLFVRLNRLMDALSTQLIDPKTGRPFEACIPRSCFPPGPDPEEQQKRIMAETQARMWQAENHARQVEQARRQMEAHHIINENTSQVLRNMLGGWTVDAYGNKTYEPGIV
ncbi:hypothetical protein Focb16_v004292 [Fusarium oxysporum f. sp. cubense]|uniref:ZZ-type domain-containing protein n=1 Tax=Fusarium oxysporum f. sp. cubense TaxID=61366 RepID=A0A559KS11_FUSOC|nr:hypothetical protein Focb16_v004292 [Fusarium oxysporum f. sp. cubense]